MHRPLESWEPPNLRLEIQGRLAARDVKGDRVMLMCDHPLPVNFSEAKGGAPGRTILRRLDYVHFGSDPRRQNTQRRWRQLPRS